MSTGLIERVTHRTPMSGHHGRSGALLERAQLDDGRRVVIKTASPALDLAMVVTDDTAGRERLLWLEGALDRLPPGAEHCILDARLGHRGEIVTVMTDLGDDVIGWDDRLTAPDSQRIIDTAARMHHSFTRSAPATLMPLERWLTMLSPTVMARHAGGPNPIARSVVHGWHRLRELIPRAIYRKVAAVHAEPGPFADRLRSHGVTLTHGDLWPVNLALSPTGVVLLDWGLATAGPGVIDLATFVTSTHGTTDIAPHALIDQYTDATNSGPTAIADGFLATLCVFGWNSALAATRNDGPAATGASGQLDWWIARFS